MSENGKYDVKRTRAASCMKIGKPNVFRQDFWQDFRLRENNC